MKSKLYEGFCDSGSGGEEQVKRDVHQRSIPVFYFIAKSLNNIGEFSPFLCRERKN